MNGDSKIGRVGPDPETAAEPETPDPSVTAPASPAGAVWVAPVSNIGPITGISDRGQISLQFQSGNPTQDLRPRRDFR